MFLAVSAAGQDALQDAPEPPAYADTVEGVAQLGREGQSEELPVGMPIVPGDRVSTEAGRVRLTLTAGTGTIHIDRYTELEVIDDRAIRMVRGRILVSLLGTRPGDERIEVDTPGATVRVMEDGDYRVAVGGRDVVEVQVAVLRGFAEVVNDQGRVRLATGEHTRIDDGGAPTAAEWFNAADSTTLEAWAARQAVPAPAVSTSQTYLPDELDSYAGTFDQYGSWQSDAAYGYVWYPRVSVGWRPYFNGRWGHIRKYGWTWLPHDPWWGWPTHHYGRWSLSPAGRWYWAPSKQWGPAWVYWATAPNYVGWCPLGWNGRPVVAFKDWDSVNGRGRHGARTDGDHWRAWTMLPSDRFGHRDVPSHRVARADLEHRRPRFVMQHVPPPAAHRPSRWADRSPDVAPVRRPGLSTPADRTTSDGTRGLSASPAPAGSIAAPRAPSSRERVSPWDRARRVTDDTPAAAPDGSGFRQPSRGAYEGVPVQRSRRPFSDRDAPDRDAPDRDDRSDDRARGAPRPGMSTPPLTQAPSGRASSYTPRPGMSGPPESGVAAPRNPEGRSPAPPSSRTADRPSSANDGSGSERSRDGGARSRGEASSRRPPR